MGTLIYWEPYAVVPHARFGGGFGQNDLVVLLNQDPFLMLNCMCIKPCIFLIISSANASSSVSNLIKQLVPNSNTAVKYLSSTFKAAVVE